MEAVEPMLSDELCAQTLERINRPLLRAKQISDANAWRSKVNPYREKITKYPERVLLFESFEKEKEKIKHILSEKQKAYLELCSGSGRHLIDKAASEEAASFFGVELRFKRVVRTIEKAISEEVNNVYMLRTDAKLVANIFPKASFDGFYINFPDPWEKLRGRKHRVLNEALLQRASYLLKANGFLSIKTDHLEYFDSFLASVGRDKTFSIEQMSRDLYQSEYLKENIATEFEKLFCQQGLPIYYVKLRAQ